MRDTITLVKEKIKETTEAFYQGDTVKGYGKVSEVAVYLIDLNQKVVKAIENGELSGYEQGHFMEILTEMMNALTEKDAVLLSDILQYDMLEELEQLEVCL